jgi:hypothetical protein
MQRPTPPASEALAELAGALPGVPNLPNAPQSGQSDGCGGGAAAPGNRIKTRVNLQKIWCLKRGYDLNNVDVFSQYAKMIRKKLNG